MEEGWQVQAEEGLQVQAEEGLQVQVEEDLQVQVEEVQKSEENWQVQILLSRLVQESVRDLPEMC